VQYPPKIQSVLENQGKLLFLVDLALKRDKISYGNSPYLNSEMNSEHRYTVNVLMKHF